MVVTVGCAEDAAVEFQCIGSDADPAQRPPTCADELAAWLKEGRYASWAAEPAPHASTGPHFGRVRTFVNAALDGSLPGDGPHPVGSAAVKELYGDGETVLGWSVMVRVDATAGGSGWWWSEDFGGKTYASSVGASLCTGCHSAGKDFVRTPWPP